MRVKVGEPMAMQQRPSGAVRVQCGAAAWSFACVRIEDMSGKARFEAAAGGCRSFYAPGAARRAVVLWCWGRYAHRRELAGEWRPIFLKNQAALLQGMPGESQHTARKKRPLRRRLTTGCAQPRGPLHLLTQTRRIDAAADL